jgi:hypothetical protein
VGNNGETLVADSSTSTGLDWKTAAEQYPWQTWTPTYERLTIGNGTVVARYQQIGKTINFFYRLTWGSTTSCGSYPVVSAPVAALPTNQYEVGFATLADVTVANYVGAVSLANGGVNLLISTIGSGGSYGILDVLNATTPGTWTTNDVWCISGMYEAA